MPRAEREPLGSFGGGVGRPASAIRSEISVLVNGGEGPFETAT